MAACACSIASGLYLPLSFSSVEAIAEALRGHFIGSAVQPLQTGIDDVFAHRAGAGAHGWKDVTDRLRHCLDLPEQLYSLPR